MKSQRVLIACEFSGVVRDAFRAQGHDAWSCDILPTETPSPYHLCCNIKTLFGHPKCLDCCEDRHQKCFSKDCFCWCRKDKYNREITPFVPYPLTPKFVWDMMIAFPPCTHLAVSGARWFKDKQKEQEEALNFVRYLMNVPIEKIAIENPIGVISTKIRKPDQIIQPWQFGHGETKATCLWLKNLPLLVPTKIVSGRVPRVHYESPGPDRWKNRSRTYQGFADAMSLQWSVNNSIKQQKLF